MLKQRRCWSWLRPHTTFVVAFAVVLGIAVLTASRYRAHLVWCFTASRLGLHDVQAIPNRPMPECPTPNGWVRCHVGCIAINLPPELASNRLPQKNGESFSVFQCGTRAVVIAPPTDANEFSGFLTAATELRPGSQQLTVPRLRLACYQASSGDFRWSMTADEVRWHAFCITTGQLIRPMSAGHTESFFRKDCDGIIHFGRQRAIFEWQSKERMRTGYVHFIDRSEQADPSWIRAACQSVTVSGDTEDEPTTTGWP